MRALFACVLAASAALAPLPATAEQFLRAGGVDIHYNAFHADAIPADVARTHGIARSRNRGVVNVTVRTTSADGLGRAAQARVTGTVANLAGQVSPLAFREVRERDALYYLAEFAIAGEDRYRFELEVLPTGAARAESIRFEQPLVGR